MYLEEIKIIYIYISLCVGEAVQCGHTHTQLIHYIQSAYIPHSLVYTSHGTIYH